MHYESVITSDILQEIALNTKEVATNLYVSELPSFGESIGYELQQGLLIVKYEQNEDERIAYGSVAYRFETVPGIVAAVCALHKRRFLKVGVSSHTIHVAVNHPDAEYIAVQDTHYGLLKHQTKGLLFLQEKEFFMAVPGHIVAQLYVDRMGLSIGHLIPEQYLVRFDYNGKFQYFPVSYAFMPEHLRQVCIEGRFKDLDWDGKRTEIENFVEEYTR